jgi:hypothetical protein
VVEALSRVGKTVCLPACITVDHGTEFTSRALDFRSGPNCLNSDLSILSGISADSQAASSTVGSITA